MPFFYRYLHRYSLVHVHLEDGTCPCGFEDAKKRADEDPDKYFIRKGFETLWMFRQGNKEYACNTFWTLQQIIGCKKCRAYIENHIDKFTINI